MIDFESLNHDYRDVLQERRQANTSEHFRRIREISEKFPEIRHIDEEVSHLSAEFGKKQILSSLTPEEKKAGWADLQRHLASLSGRKKNLLSSHGYPADYLDPIYTCPICHDEGYTEGQLCTCVRKMQIHDLYRSSNLANQLAKENFRTFNLSYYSQEPYKDLQSPRQHMSAILKQTQHFCETFGKEDPKSLLIYGETGLGKTFLSNCIAKELLDKGFSVLYLTSNELFEEILSPYLMSHTQNRENTTLGTAFRFLHNADLLILDDLGTEVSNNFTRAQFFELINRRIIERKSTIISTNLDLQSIRDRYSERIMSRLVDHYEFLYLYGKNIRYIKKKLSFSKKG